MSSYSLAISYILQNQLTEEVQQMKYGYKTHDISWMLGRGKEWQECNILILQRQQQDVLSTADERRVNGRSMLLKVT